MNNWDLTYFCKDLQDFENKFTEVKELITKISTYKGQLGEEDKFTEFCLIEKEIFIKIGNIYEYASMGSHLDMKDVKKAGLLSRCQNLFNQVMVATSFSEPEILSCGKAKIIAFIDNNQKIEEFRFIIEDMFRKAKHILSTESENILSTLAPNGQRAESLYSSLSIADNVAETINLNGEKVQISQSNWTGLIANEKSARNRKKIFEALYKNYETHKNTYAAIYDGDLTANKANAKVRGYDSVLESYLYENNIPTQVFTNLIGVASKKNSSLKKYYRLRKKYLHLTNHYSYDRFLPLATSKKQYTYEEAKELFFASIKNCPKDFQEKAHEVLRDGFVDVYPKVGKRSGAYSSSWIDMHPFILFNYDNQLEDVFTVVHESGHSIHSMYAMENQPGMLQDYTIFVAEIASTFNEHMLLDHLMETGDLDKQTKITLLQKAIDGICSTFYRQALFAQYEYEAAKLKDEDQAINCEVLSNIMVKLYKQYYGINIEKEKVKKYVWIYIPHLFYTPFYVYQYATSFAASFKLYKNVKENGNEAFAQYLNLLKSGGSKYPMDEAKDAGVDFTKKETFMAVVERMDELVNQLEKLLEE